MDAEEPKVVEEAAATAPAATNPVAPEVKPSPQEILLDEVEEANDADFMFYVGEISRPGYAAVTALCESKKKRPNALLLLTTSGGDPDAGYRIARCLRHHYKKLSIYTPAQCKSAGTLICLSADEIVMGDEGELGPLDIQISKPDEIYESGSGLDVTESLDILKQYTIDSFEQYLLEIRLRNGISTKTAAELAAKLVTGIYACTDPVKTCSGVT